MELSMATHLPGSRRCSVRSHRSPIGRFPVVKKSLTTEGKALAESLGREARVLL